MKALFVLLLCFIGSTAAFYLPGVAPVAYKKGANVSMKVNSIKSTKTAIPYDYYSLMVCRPESQSKGGKIKADAENMGELLWGELIKPSRYVAHSLIDVTCSKVCTTRPKNSTHSKGKDLHRGLKKLKTRIDDEYRGHLIVDNLPVSEVYLWEGAKKGGGFYYRRGYPLGTPGNKTFPSLVSNHLAFTIKYHSTGDLNDGVKIVGFEVVPYSIANRFIDSQCKNGNDEWLPDTYPAQTVTLDTAAISWSYSIKWVEDPDVEWSSRWDHYLQSSDASNEHIHWFAIVNSLLIVLFLSGMVAMILLRALHKDFNRYNNPENEDEAQEETGWKMVHADVFRVPQSAPLLAVYVGTGNQLFFSGLVTLAFALAGFLSPARRGWLMKMLLISFSLMGIMGGFTTAVIAKMFHAQSWRTVGMTALLVPGQIFGAFFLINLMLWGKEAASAVPFTTLLGLAALWLFVSLPLVFIGGVLGYKLSIWTESPQKVSQLARPIPAVRWYMKPWIIALVSGAVPFGAAFVELYFVLSSLWLNKFYYVFGFFGIVFLILVITCTEVAIVLVYFQLCYENYNWWWSSFTYAASSGLWLFLYGIYYFWTSLDIQKFWSIILYFSYMGIMSYFVAVMMGALGFFGSAVFVRYVYANLKVE